MSAVLTLDIELALDDRFDDDEQVEDVARRRLTLDETVARAWHTLTAHREVACPVCGGTMAPRYGSGAVPVGGRCPDCGATLD